MYMHIIKFRRRIIFKYGVTDLNLGIGLGPHFVHFVPCVNFFQYSFSLFTKVPRQRKTTYVVVTKFTLFIWTLTL